MWSKCTRWERKRRFSKVVSKVRSMIKVDKVEKNEQNFKYCDQNEQNGKSGQGGKEWADLQMLWAKCAEWSKRTSWERKRRFSNVVIKVWCMLCCAVRWKFWVDFGDSCAKENLKVLCSGEKWTFSWPMCCGNGRLAELY